VEDSDIKIKLLLGEKTANASLKLQAMLLQNGQQDIVESQATSGVAAPMEGRQKMTAAGNVTKDPRETRGIRQESLNGHRVTTEKRTGEVDNRRKTSGGRQRREDAGVYIKAVPSRVDCHYGECRP
jgi:hypothetical protein